MLNCTELDHTWEYTHNLVVEHPSGIVVAISLLFVVGIAHLAYGERIIRPSGALIGGIATLVIVFVASRYVLDLSCEARVIVAAVLAVLVALSISCVLKSGVFLVGSAGLAGVTHIVYDALPITAEQSTSSFQLMGRSGYYYIAMLVAILGGGVLSYTQRTKLLRILSSAVGGGCIVLGLHLIWVRSYDTDIPSIATLIVILLCTVAGAFLQHYLAMRRIRGRRRREDVPVGIPVRAGAQ